MKQRVRVDFEPQTTSPASAVKPSSQERTIDRRQNTEHSLQVQQSLLKKSYDDLREYQTAPTCNTANSPPTTNVLGPYIPPCSTFTAFFTFLLFTLFETSLPDSIGPSTSCSPSNQAPPTTGSLNSTCDTPPKKSVKRVSLRDRGNRSERTPAFEFMIW